MQLLLITAIAGLIIYGLISFFIRSRTDQPITWTALEAVSVGIFIYFFSQFAASVIVAIYPGMRQWTAVQATEWLEHSVTAQFALVLLIQIISLLLLRAFLRRRQRSFQAIGLIKPRLRDAGYALLGFGVYFLSYLVVIASLQRLIPSLNLEQEQDILFSLTTSGAALVLVFVALVLLTPLTEEILTRGFLYSGLRTKFAIVPAAIITSLLFAAAHLQWGSAAPLLWVAAVDTFILSLVLVYLREKTGGLWASIGLHAIKNAIAFMVLFIFK